MAPQTNIGSSTPITTNGQDFSKDLRRKIVNDAAAYIGELAREHGRNVALAEQMVRQATNYGARDALRLHVVDAVAPTLPVLLTRRSTARGRCRRASCCTPRERRSSASTCRSSSVPATS